MTLTRNTSRLVLSFFKESLSSSINSLGKHNLQTSGHSVLIFKRSTSTVTVCWKCGKERSGITQLFCEKCHMVQTPLEKENYFKVFDLDEKFEIDQQELRNKFRTMQSLLHPDKFSNKSDQEQNISAEYSSLVNKAYNNLQIPLKRAEHLLGLKGEHIGEGQTAEDASFLMKVMELNEEVENAGDDMEKLKGLNAENKKELQRISKEINDHFNKNDINAAKLSIVKLKYFNSLSERINRILRELGATD